MLVAGDTNRAVQSYAGNNATGTSYLITFTVGNTTFPQFGWSAIVAPITGEFPPVPPRMLVAGDTNRAVQSYAGNNATGTSYLIT
ncbi:hypothetical protein BOQ60_25710, partial [Chryseobacterium sp. CH1]